MLAGFGRQAPGRRPGYRQGRAKHDRIAGIRSRVEREMLSGFEPMDERRLRKLLRKATNPMAASTA